MKKIWIITLFPEYFTPLVQCGVAGSALRGERGADFEINVLNLVDFTTKGHKDIDDAPYGGGAGMIMRADILEKALLNGVVKKGEYKDLNDLHVIYPSPRGTVWNSKACTEFSEKLGTEFNKDLVFICGRYEGIDERFISQYVNEQISIGDFVLTGGELATLIILDSALRFTPGVLGNKRSSEEESFQKNLLEHPQYTRPREFNGEVIPEVLLSGHHENIEKWKKQSSLEMTKKYRPDLLGSNETENL